MSDHPSPYKAQCQDRLPGSEISPTGKTLVREVHYQKTINKNGKSKPLPINNYLEWKWTQLSNQKIERD
jgi:hypothetical protein